MYNRILIPTDGSACSDAAIVHGVAVAKATGATVVFLFVMDTLSSRREGVVSLEDALEALEARGKTILTRAEAAASAAGVRAEGELVEGSPQEAIVHRAPGFDLLVMGSHGEGLWRRLTLGSVTQAVLHKIACPLLVVPCAHKTPTDPP